MTRKRYLQEVIAIYLQAPDTPQKARRTDWAVATTFFQQAIPIADIAHAIRLTALRRLRRERGVESLEPIYSLAYIRPLLLNLTQEPHDQGYVEYVLWSYQSELDSRRKTADRRQNTAGSDRR